MEQRQVAGLEPPSEQRSEGQPGYLGESLLHLHPHRAPIMATQPTDILLTDIRATLSRAMDIQATREAPPTPVPPAMDTQAPRGTPPTRVPQVMDCQATGIPRLLRSSGLWIPRLFGIPRLPRLTGLRIPEPPALLSLLQFRLWLCLVWLSRRSRFGGLVAWGRVRYRAIGLSFGLIFNLNLRRRSSVVTANACVKIALLAERMSDTRWQQRSPCIGFLLAG